MAKKNDITGKRALAQALAWRMARDREEGLALKKDKAIQDNERDIDLRLGTILFFRGKIVIAMCTFIE